MEYLNVEYAYMAVIHVLLLIGIAIFSCAFFIFNKSILTLMKIMHWGLSRRQKEKDSSSVNKLSCGIRQWQGCTIGQKGQ